MEKLIGNHLFSTDEISYCEECKQETATRIQGAGHEAEYVCVKCGGDK